MPTQISRRLAERAAGQPEERNNRVPSPADTEPAIQIRQAATQDCRGLARIQVDSFRSAYSGFFPDSYLERFSYEEQEQDWADWLARYPDDILLVACQGDEDLVGYVLVRVEPDIHPGFDAEILALHIHPSFRSRGAGKALLREAVHTLGARGCTSVMLWTLKGNPIRTWYERLQGTTLAETSDQVDGWDIEEVAYGWNPLYRLKNRLSPL